MRDLYKVTVVALMTVSAYFSTQLKAQTPEKMSYQALVRDASNKLVANKKIGMQISILKNTATGTSVYVETHSPTTNANGLVSLEIGTGTVESGNFSTIDWANDIYFIKTETDPSASGGTNYTITGTTQLMSVPYALHAKTADSLIGGIIESDPIYSSSIAYGIAAADTVLWNNHTDSTAIANMGFVAGGSNNHYIGELFGGGIVYYVYDNGLHGLIASLKDLDNGGVGVIWSGNVSAQIGVAAQSFYDGKSNTAAMVTQSPSFDKAGTLCNSYSKDGFTDWYLPSAVELSLLYNASFLISTILINDGDNTTQPFQPDFDYSAPTYGRYWSSTEVNGFASWYYDFTTSEVNNDLKNSSYRVRATRSF